MAQEVYLTTLAPLVAEEAPAVLLTSNAWRSRQLTSHPHPLRDIAARTAVVIPHPVQQQLAIFIQQAVRTHLVIVQGSRCRQLPLHRGNTAAALNAYHRRTIAAARKVSRSRLEYRLVFHPSAVKYDPTLRLKVVRRPF